MRDSNVKLWHLETLFKKSFFFFSSNIFFRCTNCIFHFSSPVRRKREKTVFPKCKTSRSGIYSKALKNKRLPYQYHDHDNDKSCLRDKKLLQQNFQRSSKSYKSQTKTNSQRKAFSFSPHSVWKWTKKIAIFKLSKFEFFRLFCPIFQFKILLLLWIFE